MSVHDILTIAFGYMIGRLLYDVLPIVFIWMMAGFVPAKQEEAP